jgi:hypothetical protein
LSASVACLKPARSKPFEMSNSLLGHNESTTPPYSGNVQGGILFLDLEQVLFNLQVFPLTPGGF